MRKPRKKYMAKIEKTGVSFFYRVIVLHRVKNGKVWEFVPFFTTGGMRLGQAKELVSDLGAGILKEVKEAKNYERRFK